jgi:hypothetical protein
MIRLRKTDNRNGRPRVKSHVKTDIYALSISVLAKIQIFRMANCLLLWTAQLMTAGDLNA